MKNILLLFLYLALPISSVFAQTNQDSDDNQSWNDVQATVPMTKEFDFFLQGTWRFGKNITWLNDRRICL